VGDVRIAAPPQASAPDPAAGLSIYKDNPSAASGAPAFVPPPEQPTPRPTGASPAVVATVPSPPPGSPAGAGIAPPAQGPVVAPAATVTSNVPPAKRAKPASIDALLADAGPPPAKAPIASPTAGGFTVQIGAFSSEALADKSWNAAAGVAPGAMAGKGKRVVAVTKADGTTLYRTAITGFDSRDQAEALCARLTAAGSSCFVR
jgi:cell division septation protein DedD